MTITAIRLRIMLIVAILLLLGGGAMASYFVLQVVREQIREVSHIRIDADVSAEAETNAFQAKMELEKPEVAQLIEFTNAILPDASYRSQFLADVKSYADQSKVTITSIAFNDTTPATGGTAVPQTIIPGVNATPVPLSLTIGEGASYDDFIGFMKKLENNLQFVQITSLNIQPSPNNPKLLASANLEIQLYVQK